MSPTGRGRSGRRSRAGELPAGVHALAALAAAAVVGSCAGSVAGDPFASSGPSGVGDRMGTHVVRFEVSCDACQIRWEAGGRGGSLTSEALWSHRIRVAARPDAPAMARLSASPAGEARSVSWIRIAVDGKVAAQATGAGPEGARRGIGSEISVEALVPPPSSPGPLDRAAPPT